MLNDFRNLKWLVCTLVVCVLNFHHLANAQNMSDLAMRARINLYDIWNFDSCDFYFDQIIEEKNTPAFAYSDYGWYLMLVDRFDEGLEYIRRAAEMAPSDVQLVTWYAWALLWAGEVTSAKQWINKALVLNPDNGETLHVASRIFLEEGAFEEAIKYAEMTASRDKNWRGIEPLALAKAGRGQEALQTMSAMIEDQNAFDCWFFVETYATLGETVKALQNLQKAFDQKFPFMPWLNLTPGLDTLHGMEQYKIILKKIDLPK